MDRRLAVIVTLISGVHRDSRTTTTVQKSDAITVAKQSTGDLLCHDNGASIIQPNGNFLRSLACHNFFDCLARHRPDGAPAGLNNGASDSASSTCRRTANESAAKHS